MNEESELKNAIGSEQPDAAWIDDMRRRYPFFTLPLARALCSLPKDSPERAELMNRLALSVADSDALMRMTDEADLRFRNFYPPKEQPRTPDTVSAIDEFLARFASSTPEEEAAIERMIFNPVPDYSQQLARETESNLPEAPAEGDNSREDRLNRFILSEHHKQDGMPVSASTESGSQATAAAPQNEQQPAPQKEPQSAPRPMAVKSPESQQKRTAPSHETSLLSESLAKIYIKSHKYERAYEILHRLSLEFPEKSRYFADQLRFLRKLIINERAKNPGDISRQQA